MPHPTRDDVARHARVSTATVSRVLNSLSDAPVSEGLRARVLAAAEEIGYRPNGAARVLASGRAHIVAFWATDCFTSYYSSVCRSVTQLGIKRNYHVTQNSWRHYSHQPNVMRSLLPWQVDGILICDVPLQVNTVLKLYRPEVPLVSLGTFLDHTLDFVEVDLYAGTVQAVRHLLSPGCRRVACMINKDAALEQDPRSRGYAHVMSEAGYAPEFISIPNQERAVARQAIVDYARDRGLPEAIFCINDDVALGCYRGLCDLGARLPDDVALVGCDGRVDLEYLETPISSIVYPQETMCEQGWDFLERRIQAPSIPIQQATLQPELVVRASSRR